MLGPVMMASGVVLPSMWVSLGTNSASFSTFSTTGWRPSLMSMTPDVVHRGTHVVVLDRHGGKGAQHVQLAPRARGGGAEWRATWAAQLVPQGWQNSSYSSAVDACPPAARIVCSRSFSSWVM